MKKSSQYYLLSIFENSSDVYNGFEEMVRERTYHYKKSSTPLDFWIVRNINYTKNSFFIQTLDNQQKDGFKKGNAFSKGFTIITTNKIFFEWVKLRYGYFENITDKYISLTLKESEVNLDILKQSNYTIDGFYLHLNIISFLRKKIKLFDSINSFVL